MAKNHKKQKDHNKVIDIDQARKNNDPAAARRAQDILALIRETQKENMNDQEKNLITLKMELKQKQEQLEKAKQQAVLINGSLPEPLIVRTRMSLAGQEVESVEHFDVNWNHQMDLYHQEELCDHMAYRLTERPDEDQEHDKKPQLNEAQREAAEYEYSLRFLGRDWKPVKTVEDK